MARARGTDYRIAAKPLRAQGWLTAALRGLSAPETPAIAVERYRVPACTPTKAHKGPTSNLHAQEGEAEASLLSISA